MEIEPYKLEWEAQDHQAIESLIRQKEATPKELRCRHFKVNDAEWTSWIMLEHLYKKTPSRYPTQARGLFTMRQPNGQYTVQVRGYDKFFNLGETDMTKWSSLEQRTVGPYTITSKENGCIVFIAATSATELIATSKHMIPTPRDDPSSHGGVGYRWLQQHLASVHQTPSTLAGWLSKYRVTLVAELCDDSFEEHIIPTTIPGLYLHGINYNTITALHTLPMTTVQHVARHFGFHPIQAHTVQDIFTLRSNLSAMNENESEGIVIRCGMDSVDYFFKVKYDMYLMYREYRQVTLAILGGLDKNKNKKKLKIRFDKTLYYIHWLHDRLMDHPEWFEGYLNNKGIVAVRKAFEQDWSDGGLVGVDVTPLHDWIEIVKW
ncbi:RNA ligase-domain-containing protein [Chlamydoabsidia padenii]|nr:RNA ligase-domain-containing protein [Chlamydoabsidia padenii]